MASYEYLENCNNGIQVACTQKNLMGDNIIFISKDNTQEEIVRAVTLFIGMWTMFVWPKLNGFPGFNCVKYKIQIRE